MDFLDPKKRRRHTIQLFIGYALVAIAVLLATATLIYYAYGFGVTRQGDLVQKGLVFVSSQPSGAQLFINGKQRGTTNAKLNLDAGKYAIDIKRQGYHDWRRTINVDGGSVEHYVYPFLFPKELTTKEVATFDAAPRLTTQSPDRRWLVAQSDVNDETKFYAYDLSRSQEDVGTPVSFKIEQSLLSPSAEPATWKVVEWSSNNRHMLFLRTFIADGIEKSEYILVDRQRPEGSYNLSRELDIDAATTTLTLLDKKPDAYYVHDKASGDLSRATLDNPALEKVLSDVSAYKSHGADTIVYVTAKGAPDGRVIAKLSDDDQEYTMRTLAASATYLLNAARFDGSWYIVVGSQAEGRAFIYKDPVEQIADTKGKKAGALFALRVSKPTDVSFSANAQFVALQNGKNIHLYDIDREQAYRYEVRFPLDAPQTKIPWMDGDRFSYVSDGKQVAFDYDNINRHTLVSASSTYESVYDRNYEYLYTFTARSDGQPGLALTATPLRIKADL
jgi:DNA-binding NarL/FixJ family response regulator